MATHHFDRGYLVPRHDLLRERRLLVDLVGTYFGLKEGGKWKLICLLQTPLAALNSTNQ